MFLFSARQLFNKAAHARKQDTRTERLGRETMRGRSAPHFVSGHTTHIKTGRLFPR
jgi:hypothetical protein